MNLGHMIIGNWNSVISTFPTRLREQYHWSLDFSFLFLNEGKSREKNKRTPAGPPAILFFSKTTKTKRAEGKFPTCSSWLFFSPRLEHRGIRWRRPLARIEWWLCFRFWEFKMWHVILNAGWNGIKNARSIGTKPRFSVCGCHTIRFN